MRLGGRAGEVGGDDGRESTVAFLDTGGACGLEGGMIGFGAPLAARIGGFGSTTLLGN